MPFTFLLPLLPPYLPFILSFSCWADSCMPTDSTDNDSFFQLPSDSRLSGFVHLQKTCAMAGSTSSCATSSPRRWCATWTWWSPPLPSPSTRASSAKSGTCRGECSQGCPHHRVLEPEVRELLTLKWDMQCWGWKLTSYWHWSRTSGDSMYCWGWKLTSYLRSSLSYVLLGMEVIELFTFKFVPCIVGGGS